MPAQDVDEQTVSALALLDENIQPISAEPDLRAELNRLASEQDVGGLIALFDMYIAAADAMLSIQNQP